MAVTKFEGGWSMTAAGDVASDAAGFNIRVDRVIIVKATAGTVTLKDGAGNVCLLTHSIADLAMTQIDFGGAQMSGIEYDAVSAGTAVVYVYGHSIGQFGAK